MGTLTEWKVFTQTLTAHELAEALQQIDAAGYVPTALVVDAGRVGKAQQVMGQFPETCRLPVKEAGGPLTWEWWIEIEGDDEVITTVSEGDGGKDGKSDCGDGHFADGDSSRAGQLSLWDRVA